MVDPFILHTHQCMFTDDLPFWQDLARRHPGPILELGCGSGRVSTALAQAGFRLTGIDRDFNMLAFFRRNSSCSLNNQIHVVQADFTHFNFAARFALIIMPCNTFSTLSKSGRRHTLNMIHRHLLPTGLFAVQLTNPLLLASLPTIGEPEVDDTFTHPVTGEAVQVSSSWQRTSDRMTVTWTYDLLSTDGKVSRSAFSVGHFLEKPSNLRTEFKRENLIIKSELGNYEYESFQEDSPNWIVLAGLP